MAAEPYSDEPGRSGMNTAPADVVRATAGYAIANGFQLCVRLATARTAKPQYLRGRVHRHPKARDARWRVEHAQHIAAADIPASPNSASSHPCKASTAPPTRPTCSPGSACNAPKKEHVWRKLIESGALVINGTDVPVEEVDPIASFYASVTQLKDGSTFYPAQSMTRLEALRSTRSTPPAPPSKSMRKARSARQARRPYDSFAGHPHHPRSADPRGRNLYTIVGAK
jgi:predicted amidohydrolase YtcJ